MMKVWETHQGSGPWELNCLLYVGAEVATKKRGKA